LAVIVVEMAAIWSLIALLRASGRDGYHENAHE
jgi:hypothetical protein